MKEITSKEALEIIENRKPLGLFYVREEELWIGIDNSTGDAWTEEFYSKKACLKWLKNEFDDEVGLSCSKPMWSRAVFIIGEFLRKWI